MDIVILTLTAPIALAALILYGAIFLAIFIAPDRTLSQRDAAEQAEFLREWARTRQWN